MANDPNVTPNPNPNPNPPADPANPPADPATPTDEMVSKSVHEQIKTDLFKEKEKRRLLEEQLANSKINAMKEKQDWEGIAKAKEQEAEEFKSKYEGLSKSLIEQAKQSALKTAALKAGILEQSLADVELLDFSEIVVETTSTGKILVSGADQAIENLKRRRPHWFGTKAASINPASPESLAPSNGTVTLQQIKDAEAAYKKAPDNKSLQKAYFDLLIAFKKQNP